jgi:DNA-binding CsgD family transcriptional regulator
MNFTTKEMAHLLNISGRAIEIGRYRLRRKMNLERTINLTEFLINEAEPEVNQ